MASGGASPALEATPLSHTPLPLSPFNPNSTDPKAANGSKKIRICVFCGSSPGTSPAHMEMARSLGKAMADIGASLTFGGGTVGLMGEVARTLVSLSGPESVHGVIPAPLVKYERGPESQAASNHSTPDSLPAYEIYGKTTVVKDMHTRKKLMAQEVLSGGPGSGFIALSGGYGTLEELMEVVTWNQLGIHNRGVVVLNVEGYWDGLMKWVENSVEAGFVGEKNRTIIKEAKTAEDAVRELRDYHASEGRFKLEWDNE